MTKLDDALKVVRHDPEQGHVFYDAFLNSDMYIPVHLKDEKPHGRQVGIDEKFHPLFVKFDGKKTVPMFDSLERLNEWAEGNDLDYVLVRAHLFLTLLDASVEVGLNPGTDFAHHFTGSDLERIRSAIGPAGSS